MESRRDAENCLSDNSEEDKKRCVQLAINEAVDTMGDDLPMMMQLCKIKEATCRAEQIFEERAAMPKTQSKDPRIPKEVLIEQGISPNLGPLRARKGKNHFGKLVVLITSVMTAADCSTDARTCVGWAPVGTTGR